MGVVLKASKTTLLSFQTIMMFHCGIWKQITNKTIGGRKENDRLCLGRYVGN